ncbi:putative signal peptide protein [Puccinia sorghi]|uniref:Putative signal peptide protein n=1 Tax=Puccinia sorghi TaxID=27349 RepID=A0A0L6UWM0_9BASI|nr:putative signal peptide protein [Puccinia sorghi]
MSLVVVVVVVVVAFLCCYVVNDCLTHHGTIPVCTYIYICTLCYTRVVCAALLCLIRNTLQNTYSQLHLASSVPNFEKCFQKKKKKNWWDCTLGCLGIEFQRALKNTQSKILTLKIDDFFYGHHVAKNWECLRNYGLLRVQKSAGGLKICVAHCTKIMEIHIWPTYLCIALQRNSACKCITHKLYNSEVNTKYLRTLTLVAGIKLDLGTEREQGRLQTFAILISGIQTYTWIFISLWNGFGIGFFPPYLTHILNLRHSSAFLKRIHMGHNFHINNVSIHLLPVFIVEILLFSLFILVSVSLLKHSSHNHNLSLVLTNLILGVALEPHLYPHLLWQNIIILSFPKPFCLKFIINFSWLTWL